MELSKNVTEGLASLANVSLIAEENFCEILEAVISQLQENPVEMSSISKAADSKVVLTKKIFADVLCLFVEAAQHDLNEESFKSLLSEHCPNEQRVTKLLEAYAKTRNATQSRLESISCNNPPHIVDVDWRLDYRVKLDTCNSLGVPLYHVRLSTKEHERTNDITFSCTIQQLQELVFKLKDAIRYSEKLTNV